MQHLSKFMDLMCTYKYVLEMSPRPIHVSELRDKILKKHKKEFLHKKLDFLISPFYKDENYWYIQIALDFDGKYAIQDAKDFLRRRKHPRYFIAEVTSETGVHIVSRYVVPFPRGIDLKEKRKQILENSNARGYDKIASQNINPFRRFPSRSTDKTHLLYPLNGEKFLAKTKPYIIKEFKTFNPTEKEFERLVDFALFKIQIFKTDPEGIM